LKAASTPWLVRRHFRAATTSVLLTVRRKVSRFDMAGIVFPKNSLANY
jgi:hypothetical protein